VLSRSRLLGLVMMIGGCAGNPPSSEVPVPAMDVQPLQVTTTYIAALVPHFARGQYAIVEICVSPDGAIDAARVTQSSADRAFDAAAMTWARQARYRPRLENGRPVYGCEEVRVEINPDPGAHLAGGPDSALG
jgi:TonB family protein